MAAVYKNQKPNSILLADWRNSSISISWESLTATARSLISIPTCRALKLGGGGELENVMSIAWYYLTKTNQHIL